MIFQVKNEQREEDEHKDWCDQALSKTKLSIDDKNDKIEELLAKINDAAAQANQLQEDILAADNMVEKITGHVEEATEIREVGKEENKVAVKDAQDAQTAVANAVAVLTDFYKESGEIAKEPYEFIQSKEPVDLPENPSTWDSSYTGVADPAHPEGILTLLKEVSSQFSKMEADTKAQEETDQAEYDEDMKRCDIEKARRSKESDMKDQERKRLTDKTATLTKSKKQVSSELEAVEQYLKEYCRASGARLKQRGGRTLSPPA